MTLERRKALGMAKNMLPSALNCVWLPQSRAFQSVGSENIQKRIECTEIKKNFKPARAIIFIAEEN